MRLRLRPSRAPEAPGAMHGMIGQKKSLIGTPLSRAALSDHAALKAPFLR
jgi:hypothetical protein